MLSQPQPGCQTVSLPGCRPHSPQGQHVALLAEVTGASHISQIDRGSGPHEGFSASLGISSQRNIITSIIRSDTIITAKITEFDDSPAA